MADTLRVFLSSTAIDLEEHRKAVSDTILRLEHLPISMESFGAIARPPIDVCREKVLSCDAVVVIVAHRYGWVPSKAQGGDEKRSITWFEADIAREAGIPVLSYLVDLEHPWSLPKEQDLLADAQDEADFVRIGRNVKSLGKFRAFLSSDAGLTCDDFTTPDDLATRVTASLARLEPRVDQGASSSAQAEIGSRAEYAFHLYHPLQPAKHFRGRENVLTDLYDWWKDPAHVDRVRSLVAMGGAGKTAIAAEFLSRIRGECLNGHVFLWSFYEDPNTDSFLYEACAVFAGEQSDGAQVGDAGGRLARLQRALRDGAPHLLILDGAERVQSDGKGNRAFGELSNHQLKNLLRCIASGLGSTRALVTTRSPLADLERWEGRGYQAYDLEQLDEQSSIAVLKAWRVRGTDERLAGLAADIGNHALSVSVLGSYLHEYADGDPAQAPSFDPEEASESGPEGARLHRILSGYAEALPGPELDMLVRLSVFPRGVSQKILTYLARAGEEIAGHLNGADQRALLRHARKLVRLGLVFEYQSGTAGEVRFTAHPFLRDYFRQLVGIEVPKIHQAVRTALAPSLEGPDSLRPRDKNTLDRYEELIEYTIGAGEVDTAFDLYARGMGRLKHLSTLLGEFARGARVVSMFVKDRDSTTPVDGLSDFAYDFVTHDWGMYATYLGDVVTAERAFTANLDFWLARDDPREESMALQVLSWLSRLRGRGPDAKSFAERAYDAACRAGASDYEIFSLARQAFACHILGEVTEATDFFSQATDQTGLELTSGRGLEQAEHRFRRGELDAGRKQTESNLEISVAQEWNEDAALCHYLLGLFALPEGVGECGEHLTALRAWSDRTGHMEATLKAHHLASELARASRDVKSAIAEAEIGLTLADGCGFGLAAVDLLLSLARAQLDAPAFDLVRESAGEALERCRHPDCGYAWGEAEALVLLAKAEGRLDRPGRAKELLQQALELQTRLRHPRAGETRESLERLS